MHLYGTRAFRRTRWDILDMDRTWKIRHHLPLEEKIAEMLKRLKINSNVKTTTRTTGDLRKKSQTQCLAHTAEPVLFCSVRWATARHTLRDTCWGRGVIPQLLPLSHSGGHLLRTGCLPRPLPALLSWAETRWLECFLKAWQQRGGYYVVCPGKGPSATGQVLWVEGVAVWYACLHQLSQEEVGRAAPLQGSGEVDAGPDKQPQPALFLPACPLWHLKSLLQWPLYSDFSSGISSKISLSSLSLVLSARWQPCDWSHKSVHRRAVPVPALSVHDD